MSGIITLNGLTKDYGHGRGIFDISFEVEQGEIFGYVGTNGAGKTTTIRNMLGFVYPTSGSSRVAGMDPTVNAAEIMTRVSYIPGEIAFPNLSTGTAFLKLQAEYNGITDFTYTNYVAKLLALDTTANLKRMSKGMKQKTAIVAALMADRDILILDEPTTGLDPLQRDNFLQLMREEKDKGKTIFMSGHIFEELEDICDRVAMIKDGHLVDIISMHDLRNNYDRQYRIEFADGESVTKFLAKNRTGVREGLQVRLSVPPEKSDYIMKSLKDCAVVDVEIKNMTLEDAFMKEYRT